MTVQISGMGGHCLKIKLSTVRYIVVAASLALLAFETAPAIVQLDGKLVFAGLWLCYAVFALELLFHLFSGTGAILRRVVSLSTLISALAVVPVPLALAAGLPRADAWLFASLWVLKLLPTGLPDLPQIERVLSRELKSMVAVLVLYLSVLFLSWVGNYPSERHIQPTTFGSLPSTIWWALTSGVVDVQRETVWGHALAALNTIIGFGVLGLWMGMLANGLMEESRRQEFIHVWGLVVKCPFLKSAGAAAIAEIARMLRKTDVSGSHNRCQARLAGRLHVFHRVG